MTPESRAEATTARVVLYTARGCSLCDDAREMLDALGVPYETAYDEAYRTRIPVIEVDGRVVTEGRVSERAVRRAITRRSRNPI